MVFAAIDWAEESHLAILLDEQGEVLERARIQNDPYGLAHLDWLLTRHRDGQTVLVAIELHDPPQADCSIGCCG